jgi:hypothetical protein
MTTLTVGTDSTVRALSAALAATDWPDCEQKPVPRGVHPHAAMLKKHVADFRSHPAVAYVQAALDADPDPLPLFDRAVKGDAELIAHLQSFSAEAALDSFWAEHDSVWASAVADVQKHVLGVDFTGILGEAFSAVPDELIVLPNPAFPTTHSMGFGDGRRVYSLIPPRKAVGESPPWPFGDDRDYLLRYALHDFCQCLLAGYSDVLAATAAQTDQLPLPDDFRAVHPSWPKQFAELFAYGLIAIFLNRLDAGAGDAVILYDRRTKKLALLPAVVTAVANYLSAKAGGRYSTLADYIPHFAADVNGLLQ